LESGVWSWRCPLNLGTNFDDIKKISAYSDAAIQDEVSAVDQYEQLLKSMGPDLGLDPSDFNQMISEMRGDVSGECRVVPKDNTYPVLFLNKNALSRIVFSQKNYVTIDGKSVFDCSSDFIFKYLLKKNNKLYKNKIDFIFPELSIRMTSSSDSNFPDENPIEYFIIEKIDENQLIQEGYHRVQI
jgi:hypothetical protein